MTKFLLNVVLLFPILLAIGCSEQKYYPVTGIVVDNQGVPLKELRGTTVTFESVSRPISAVGEIDKDGRFSMTSERADDGCVPGEHRVAIGLAFGGEDGQPIQFIDPKYNTIKTSGLAVTVEKKKNDIRLQLNRVEKR